MGGQRELPWKELSTALDFLQVRAELGPVPTNYVTMDDTLEPAELKFTEVPAMLLAWIDVVRSSLKKNPTTSLLLSELNSLVWSSFTQMFTIDGKTLEELITLKNNSCSVFKRELEPELFHWHGTTVTFLSLNLLKPFWRDAEAIEAGKVCLALFAAYRADVLLAMPERSPLYCCR
jgi:hypothetical protein